jgi:hypothetical protein
VEGAAVVFRCHPDRSEAEWRDLLLPFDVILNEAQHSEGPAVCLSLSF